MTWNSDCHSLAPIRPDGPASAAADAAPSVLAPSSIIPAASKAGGMMTRTLDTSPEEEGLAPPASPAGGVTRGPSPSLQEARVVASMVT